MTTRRLLPFLLLGLLTVAGGLFAVVGAVQSGHGAGLTQAVANTEAEADYHEVVVDVSPQGTETGVFDYHGPDLLGGELISGNQLTYLYVDCTAVYESLTVSRTAGHPRLTYYREAGKQAKDIDPAEKYLHLADQGIDVHTAGSVTSMVLVQQGQPAHLRYTVTGNYVTAFHASAPNVAIDLALSQIGSAPTPTLPASAKVVGARPSGSCAA